MSEDNIFMLERMTNTEVKRFASLLVGLKAFVRGEECIRIPSKKAFKREIEANQNLKRIKTDFISNPYGFRYKIIGKENNISYLLYNTKNKSIGIINDNGDDIRFIKIKEFNTSELSDKIISLLLDVAHNRITEIEGLEPIEFLFQLVPNEFFFSFILGCGVSMSYGLKSWSGFEKDIKRIINTKLGCRSPVSTDIAKELSEKTFNNNYGVFQIAKQLFNDDYKQALLNLVRWDYVSFPTTTNTSLYQVARILSLQSKTGKLQETITFNYDDILEEILQWDFSVTAESEIKKTEKKSKKLKNNVKIIHTHGLIPCNSVPSVKALDYYYDNLIVTTDDYYKAYKSPGEYSYKKLNFQLNKTNFFVGNSITDYEEQKVLGNHFLNYPSHYHFALLSKDKMSIPQIMYKTLFLLNIGIIPLWFDDVSKIRDFLEQKANLLEEKTSENNY